MGSSLASEPPIDRATERRKIISFFYYLVSNTDIPSKPNYCGPEAALGCAVLLHLSVRLD